MANTPNRETSGTQATNVAPETVAKPAVLPVGLSVQISLNRKSFFWSHHTEIGSGDPTLNGLLRAPEAPGKTVPEALKVPAVTLNLGDISPEKAKVISQNYYALPEYLTQHGVGVVDAKADAFIKRATNAKATLQKKYGNRPIPAAEIKRYDAMVNEEGFTCFELVLTGFTVTDSNPKGSRQRSDGKYVTRRILRRVYIDRPLNEQALTSLVNVVCGDLITSSVREAAYRIVPRGKDNTGIDHYDLAVVNPRTINK